MSDKIREAISTVRRNWPDEKYTMLRGALEVLISKATSRDDEISELVEVIDKMINYQSPMGSSFTQWYEKIIEMGKEARVNYTKTPCPECGGKCEVDDPSVTPFDNMACPDCQGRGYKWERKG